MPDDIALPPTFLDPDRPLGPLAREYLDALLGGNRARASELVLDSVKDGVPVRDIYLEVFQRTQWEVGRLWELNRVTVAEEHYCTATTQLIMSRLYPHVFAGERGRGTLVAAAVSGDLHELGIRMVADFFEMDGWDTFFLGANTPAPGILELVERRNADVLALSATLWAHVPDVAEVIEALREASGEGGPIILVGGHPFNHDGELWRTVGADGHAPGAGGAVSIAEGLLAARRTP
jgi:MerR family transcriptional regulator, light-induced transcriptional regulator